MRKLFTFAFALFATVAMNAQDVDPSQWQAGEDVSAYLNWGDYDGSYSGEAPFFPSNSGREGQDRKPETLGDWWKGSLPSEYREVEGENIKGVYGFYVDGAKIEELIDFYQVLWMPAGFYTFKVQATYRESTNDATFNNWYNGTPKKNAWFYIDALASEDPESDVIDEFQTYIRSVMTSGVTDGPLYNGQSGGLSWMNDYKKTYKDKITGETKTVYCPTSTLSAGVYFVNGKYEHEVNVVLEKDGYVRLGIRKTANIAQDWLIFTNFRIIYNGPADDDAKLVLALEDKATAESMIEEICNQITEQGYTALATIISDQMMTLSDVDESSLADVSAAVEALENLYDQGNNALVLAKRLADLLQMSDDMIETTDYPGKAAFQSTVDDITVKATTDDPAVINNDINAYAELFGTLATARGTYLQTNDPDENGAWDFTPLVKYPWFVNPEYNPTYKQDPNDEDKWVWSLDEETWLEGMSQGFYVDKVEDADNPRTDISSEVTIGIDEDATNQWFTLMNCQGWSPGVRLYYQGHLIGASDGSNSVTGGTMEIRQRVIGLPNGYYSLRALVRGNGNATFSEDNLPEYHNIFAMNNDSVLVKSPVGHTDSYRYADYGWSEYKAGAWTEHKTGIVKVSDGELLIGGQSGMVGNFTGFRLFFYGETPNFSGMVREDIAEVLDMMQTTLIEKYGDNTFAGDTLYIIDLMNSIVFPVLSNEAYDEAFAKITGAKDYIQKAANAMANNTLAADYDKLYNKYTDPDDENYVNGPTQAAILEKPMDYVAVLGTSPEDKFEKIDEAKEVYNAYKSYLSAYDIATTLDEPELKELMATQSADLKANYRDIETLKRYETQINFLVKRATIIAAGGKNASESNPVEVTSLINNPDFTNSASSGWSGNTGTSNEYARGNSEVWDKNPMDMYQVIQGLPAGKYEIRVRALYRDARNVRDNSNQSWTSYWTDANGDVNAWERHFAQFYANTVTSKNDTIDSFAYVKSVCDGKFTEPSFTKYYRNNSSDLVEGDLIYDDEGNEIQTYDTIWTTSVPEANLYDDEGEIITSWTDEEGKVYTVAQDGPDNRYVFQDENGTPQFAWQIANTYPFDERIRTSEGVFYYPSSMLGAYYRFGLNPEAYCNTIQIEIPAGSDLRIGFRKETGVTGDWVMFDDFQLFYLGGDLDAKPELPEAINELVANKTKSSAIYNLAGQRINTLQKGLNIVGGKKVYVK